MKKALIVVVILLLLMLIYVVFFEKKIPSNPQKVANGICLHFEPNRGSSDIVFIFSYKCHENIDWNEVMHTPIYENGYLKSVGIVDVYETMENPSIIVKDDRIEIFSGWTVKVEVGSEGKFK